MGSFFGKGGPSFREDRVDRRCPGLRFFDHSLLPGASVSSSVKTDGFCSGAAGPVGLFSVSCFSGMLCGWQTLEIWITRISSSTRRVASLGMVSLICSMWSPRRSW